MRMLALVALLAGCQRAGYFEPCTESDDCGDAMTCEQSGYDERICAIRCTAANDYACPDGMTCLATRERDAIGSCVVPCESDLDCPDHLQCGTSGSCTLR